MRRTVAALLLALLLAGLPAVATAQAPNANAEAKALADRLGKERSVDGLKEIIAARNVDLFTAYEHGWRLTSQRESGKPLDPAIEALIVRHYRDPIIGPHLRTLVSANWTPYRGRELFDLLFAEWRSGDVRRATYDMRSAVLNTVAGGVEAPLLEWLQASPGPKGQDASDIVHFLAKRKYRPALPTLIAMLDHPGTVPTRSVASQVLVLGGTEGVEPVLRRIARLRESSEADARDEISFLLGQLMQVPPEALPSYARFRQVLPGDEWSSWVVMLVRKKKDPEGAREVVRLLANLKLYPGTLETIVASDSPEIWRLARAEIERLKESKVLDESRYLYASKLLDDKTRDPKKHFAEKAQAERSRELDARRGSIGAEYQALLALRDDQPARYVEGMVQHLAKLEALAREYDDLPQAKVGLAGDVRNRYLALGHYVRFRMKQPDRAIELYRRAGPGGFGGIAVADAYQFDLADRPHALAEYRRSLETLRGEGRSLTPVDAAFLEGTARWITEQIRFLETGRPFKGPIRLEDLEGGLGLVVFAGDAGEDAHDGLHVAVPAGVSSAELETRLAALPRSAFSLMRSVNALLYVTDADAIVRFLDRQDPAGYTSALLLAFFTRFDALDAGQPANSALKVAAARFFASRGILAELQPDPRMATPEKTWQLMLASLRAGDSRAALRCMTPGLAARFRPHFEGATREQLRTMADSFTSFQLTAQFGEHREATVTTKDKRAGMVYFVNVAGAWKINEM